MKRTTSSYEAATFIIRLWRDPHATTDTQPIWRGTAVHVQSGTEQAIQELDALMSFIASWLQGEIPTPEDDWI